MNRGACALTVATLLLAACGGGGGGSSGGGTTGASTQQTGLVLSPTTKAEASTLIAQSGTGGGVTKVTRSSNGGASVSFSGTTQAWAITATSFGGVEVTESADRRTVVITSPGTTASSTGTTSFEHTSYGIWLESSAIGVLTGSGNQVQQVSSFVIGDATAVGDMPRGGTATYRGNAVAVELRNGAAPRPLDGPLTATVDFGSGRLNATTDLKGSIDGAAFGRVSMSGLAISGNQFNGSATSSQGHVGSAKGGFAGPRAAELGGVFELEGPSTVHGAFAGTSR